MINRRELALAARERANVQNRRASVIETLDGAIAIARRDLIARESLRHNSA